MKTTTATEPRHDSATCHLASGNSWADCDCAEIDPTDRPCLSCLGVIDSAADGCPACKAIDRRRRAFRVTLHHRDPS